MNCEYLLERLRALNPSINGVKVSYGEHEGWEYPHRVRLSWGANDSCEACGETHAMALLEALIYMREQEAEKA